MLIPKTDNLSLLHNIKGSEAHSMLKVFRNKFRWSSTCNLKRNEIFAAIRIRSEHPVLKYLSGTILSLTASALFDCLIH